MRASVTRLLVLFVMMLGSLALPVRVANASILSRAAQLIREHKPEIAYELLSPQEEKLAGQREYDYLLGLAELDSGRAELATIALERVLVVDPNFAGARMALARAYFAMGDYSAAEVEFLKVLKYNPPPQVRLVVARYLDAIKQRAEAKRTHIHGYLATRFGHDTNANNGPGVATFVVPALNSLSVTLNPSNQKSSSSYGEVAGGVSITHQLRDGLGLYASLDTSHRDIFHAHSFDQSSINGNFGVTLGGGSDTKRVGGLLGQSYLAGAGYYHTYGINASWQHAPDRRNLWTLFGQASAIRYNQTAMFSYDTDQILAGFSGIHAMGDTGKVAVIGSLYSGYEQDLHHRADGAKSLWGGNLGAQAKLTERISLYGSLGAQLSYYKRENAAFLTWRRDKLYSTAIGLAWLLAKQLTLRTEVDYSSNNSNIALYQYRRTDISMALRRDFN